MQHQMVSRSLSLVSVAAPTDMALLIQWETHLLPLKRIGLLTFWSERHIRARVDHMAEILTHPRQAQVILLAEQLMLPEFGATG